MRFEGFNRMYALVFDIVAGNRLVEMQRCKRALVILRPISSTRNVSLFEDGDRGVITRIISEDSVEECRIVTKNFQWRV